ncbi:MAG: hypothetical protein LBT59_06110 [Clostridiales bacterium]|nr:hypothetical protein [Clostridiales bacterium]
MPNVQGQISKVLADASRRGFFRSDLLLRYALSISYFAPCRNVLQALFAEKGAGWAAVFHVLKNREAMYKKLTKYLKALDMF